jgi:crotonobetainyl-CoA:carnitine CoA-transferase CaiB-like acyl-CoA transferase
LGASELAYSEEYADNISRVRNRKAIDAMISAKLATLSYEQAASLLGDLGIGFASINTVKELSEHPQLQRSNVETSSGEIAIVSPPAQFRGETRSLGPVPGLGQHTEKVRNEFLKP